MEKKAKKASAKRRRTLSKFETSFSEARKQGKKTFDYEGKKYTTQTKEEKKSRDKAWSDDKLTTRYEPFWSDKRKVGH